MLDVTAGSIMILDDDPATVRYLIRLLHRKGYTGIRGLSSARSALEELRTEPVDLLVLDLHMPDTDGFMVMEELSLLLGDEMIPVLVLTGDESREVRNRALASGARDFLTKPLDPDEVTLRIRNLLQTRLLAKALARQNDELEERVRQRTQDLEHAQVEIMSRLACIAEYYDEDTSDHTRRVAALSGRIAFALGLPQAQVSLIGHASMLHDVGKIAVPVKIVHSPGALSPEDWELVKQHATEGARILAGSRFRLLQMAEEIARTHHERWDGTGYPSGLEGESIPLSGRIVAAADVFDALTHARPYKPAWSQEAALAEIRRISGTHLDPAVVDALVSALESCDSTVSVKDFVSNVPAGVPAVSAAPSVPALVSHPTLSNSTAATVGRRARARR